MSAHVQNQPRLILASASPRRCELLADAGYVFDVMPADVDEDQPMSAGQSPADWAAELALLKARTVADRLDDGIVLGADTIVVANGEIFGKPTNEADARRILSVLLHTPQDVITGVAIVDAATGGCEMQHDTTRIVMTPMTPAQLDDYIAGGLWRGKAGAYGIQDHDDAFVREIAGSFSNVVGLPMELVGELLARWGVQPSGGAGLEL
ncbi:MAG: septum formation protein Maf [Phycisphaerales bacterium]|nr:septum formation protein Maf [Phycisphaerales bacterium]